MLAFSRQYIRYDEEHRKITYFETYTETHKYLWQQTDADWEELEPIIHNIGKIPVVYATQEETDWHDVQICIERLEYLLSKFAETNDYHASPTIFFVGKLMGMPEKGDSGKIIQGDTGSKAEYLSWDNAPEAVKLEIETLLRFIHGLTQTPDISFDSVKGLSSISGVALEMLFMDAHLKVQEKKEILDDYLQRRINIQKRLIGMLSGEIQVADNLDIEPEIVPYKINDETTLIQNLVTANGGKAIISQKTAVKTLNWVSDTKAELKDIEEEEKRRNTYDLFEPTND